MPGDDDHPAVTHAQRTVEEPSERVLEDRFTDEPGGGGGGGGQGSGGSGGGGQGPGGSGAPVLPGPFSPRIDPGLVPAPRDHPLRIAVGVLSRQKPYDRLRFAIADMTADRTRPLYVSHGNDRARTFIASMAKLAFLLPAFALREATRSAARQVVAKSPEDLWKQLERAWGSAIRRYYDTATKNNSLPKLAEIFTAQRGNDTDPFTIDFKGDLASIDASFLLDLRLALRHSSNDSAAKTVRALGFPYIKGALAAAKLGGAAGFFLNRDFGGRFWNTSYAGSGQEGSLRAVVELLTLVAQDRLPGGPGLVQEVRDLMWWSGQSEGAASDLFKGIKPRLPEIEQVTLIGHGKVGFMDAGPFNDGVIIHRAASDQRLRYVAVVFGADSDAEVQRVGIALDDCVLLGNGLGIKPPAKP